MRRPGAGSGGLAPGRDETAGSSACPPPDPRAQPSLVGHDLPTRALGPAPAGPCRPQLSPSSWRAGRVSLSCVPSAQLRQLPVGICYRSEWGGGWRKGWRRRRQAVTLAPGAPSRPSPSRLRGSGSGPTPASPALPGTWGLKDHASCPHLCGSALSSRSPSLAWTLRSPGLSSDPDRSLAMATAAASHLPQDAQPTPRGTKPGDFPGQLSHPTGALPVPSAACWGVHACGDQEGGTALGLQPAEGLPKRVLSLSRLRRRSPGGARLSEPPRGLARYARGAGGGCWSRAGAGPAATRSGTRCTKAPSAAPRPRPALPPSSLAARPSRPGRRWGGVRVPASRARHPRRGRRALSGRRAGAGLSHRAGIRRRCARFRPQPRPRCRGAGAQPRVGPPTPVAPVILTFSTRGGFAQESTLAARELPGPLLQEASLAAPVSTCLLVPLSGHPENPAWPLPSPMSA